MKVLIDINIVLDVLLNRKPFVEDAVKTFRQAEKGQIEAHITASSVTDLVYILRKAYSLSEIKTSIIYDKNPVVPCYVEAPEPLTTAIRP